MKHRLLSAAFCGLLFLSACSSTHTGVVSFDEHMRNPLFAERYYAELIDRLTTLQINNDDVLKDKKIADRVNAEKLQALQEVEKVRTSRRMGIGGNFVSDAELTQGLTLVKDGTVYLSSDFVTYPGIDLHLYLTIALDPRDIAFPDASSLDVGPLQSPYGDQHYDIPEAKRATKYRTVVLWDAGTKRIFAFAQLN